MKKTLVTLLALVFVLGIAGTALAAPANPFVDVPAKHWAYGAVSKLAKAGIVDGYGDGTFRGDRTMTRYEMAQIVAKAMAKSEKADAEMKALIDKLAVEFAAELNNLGVRVAKLEAKTNVGFTFESRLRYEGDDNKTKDRTGTQAFDFRQRIYLSGVVNDKIDYGARIQTDNVRFGESNSNTFYINRMFFNVKDFAGIDKITLGRFPTLMFTMGLLSGSTNGVDGMAVTTKLGDTTTFKGYLASPQGNSANAGAAFGGFEFTPNKDVFFNVAYQSVNFGRIANWPYADTAASYNLDGTIKAGGVQLSNPETKVTSIDVGAAGKIGDFWLKGEYVNSKDKSASAAWNPNNQTLTRKAYQFEISNSVTRYPAVVTNMVDVMKAHTDAFAVGYRSIEHNAAPVLSAYSGQFGFLSYGPNMLAGTLAYDDNVKGWYFEYQNVLSKGLVFSFDYQDLKEKTPILAGQTGKDKVWVGRFEFYF